MIERLLRTVEKGPTTSRPDVGTSRRDLPSGPPVGSSRRDLPSGPPVGTSRRVLIASHDATVQHPVATQPRDVFRRRCAVWCRRPRPAGLQRSVSAVATRPAGAPGRTTLPVARARPACVHSGAASLQSSSARQASCSSAADQAPRLAVAQRPSAGGEALPGNPGAASEAFRGRSWLCQSRGQLDK